MKNQMTEVQREFLKILESFMHNREYHFPDNFTEMKELQRLAGIHNVTAMVCEQVQNEEVLTGGEFRELGMQMKKKTIYTVMSQVQRTEEFLRVYRHLCEEGVRPLIVKGLICRNLYGKPDFRISGDEDMLIRKEEFEICDRVLREHGFTGELPDEKKMPYEISYIQPRTGTYIEVHFSLFPEESGAYGYLNGEFQKVFEHEISEMIQGTEVWTLAPQEHIFYLICHSFKHFLHSGFGIRQVCDMVMMAEHYGGQIDWEKIGSKLKKLNMASFWAGLAEIGKNWLGFDWDKAQYCRKLQNSDVGAEELLQDLLHGGVYGNSSMERRHSSNITLTAMRIGKKNTAASLWETVFPSISYMEHRYQWLEKYLVLVPVAWAARMYSYFIRKERDGEEKISGLEIGMERVELLKKYKIIK